MNSLSSGAFKDGLCACVLTSNKKLGRGHDGC